MTAIVGPSTAILMIPRPGMPYHDMVWTYYANRSIDELFPSHVDKSHGLQLSPETLMKTKFQRTQFNGLRSLALEYPDNQTYYTRLLRLTNSSATISSRIGVVAFIQTTQRSNLSVQMMQPLVFQDCTVNSMRNNFSKIQRTKKIPYILEDGSEAAMPTNLSQIIERISSLDDSMKTERQFSQYFYPPLWIAYPEPGSASLVGIFVQWSGNGTIEGATIPRPIPLASILNSTYMDEKALGLLNVNTCTLSFFWYQARAELSLSSLSENLVDVVGIPQPQMIHTDAIKLGKPIHVDLKGVSSAQSTNFHMQLAKLGYEWDLGLAASFAVALSEIPQGTLASKRDAYSYNIMFPQGNQNQSKTKFEVISTLKRYGYGSTSTSVRLSVAVITTYCLITIAYILYMLITGSASTAWNSAIELVALALQSKRPDCLGHTSVGINSMATLRENVGIRVNGQEELDLVFANDKDIETRGLRKVKENRAY